MNPANERPGECELAPVSIPRSRRSRLHGLACFLVGEVADPTVLYTLPHHLPVSGGSRPPTNGAPPVVRGGGCPVPWPGADGP